MCGIFGVALNENGSFSEKNLKKLIKNLFAHSETRGKESTGMHVHFPDSVESFTEKSAQSASDFLNSKKFKNLFLNSMTKIYNSSKNDVGTSAIFLAHSRLVTNGKAENDINNQPVTKGDITVVHNGIIVNVDELWERHNHLEQQSEVDTEILAALLNEKFIDEKLDNLISTKQVFSQIFGSASIAWVCKKTKILTLATNTGDLFYSELPDKSGIVFASEKYILSESIKFLEKQQAHKESIKWLNNGTMASVKLGCDYSISISELDKDIERQMMDSTRATSSRQNGSILLNKYDESLIIYNPDTIKNLKRCSKCVLPDTFPYIFFDEQGVCNYCHSYKPHFKNMDGPLAKTSFIESLEKYRKNNNEPDVIVPFSGGRDSSYGLHLICKEFGLTPVTFTYDWGMVTDLARRNIARMCGKLGVQNILVSADIKTKRKNIKKNINAWLKKPNLGIVPLFMAGDKAFFKIVNDLKKQNSVKLNLWCANPLENTDFKSGLCGVRPDFDKSRLDYLSAGRKVKMINFYLAQFAMNPSYLNSSLFDTFKAFCAYYFEPRNDFFFLFNHLRWDESEVNDTLLNEYDWEIANDSPSTWRIGDGTAPFYNYIYNTAFGFSEFDTFRSNQIREGMLSREEAIKLVITENAPRIESLYWYIDVLGLDFNKTLTAINSLDKRKLHI